MNIYCVDDNPIHRTKARELIEAVCAKKGIEKPDIIECSTGAELLACTDKKVPNLILLDIHMPELDGLSTLVRFRKNDAKTKVVMVSSETKSAVARFKTGDRPEIDDARKNELLGRVVDRVVAGANEEGKINSVLEACSNLDMDPVVVAKAHGANEFIHKPYDIDDACETLARLITPSDIIS